MRLAGIEGSTLLLDIVDINRQPTETVIERYKVFQQNALMNIDVQNTINSGSSFRPTRMKLDTAKQRDVVISGIRITFVDVQPYNIRYTIEDVEK